MINIKFFFYQLVKSIKRTYENIQNIATSQEMITQLAVY